MRIPEAKLLFYAQDVLPPMGEEYDYDLYNAYLLQEMAREILELRAEHARLKNAYENRLYERRM